MLDRLPPELQTRVITLLDVTEVLTLLQTFTEGQFDALFQLITATGLPPVFFPQRLSHVALEEYSTRIKKRVFMNLLEVQMQSDVGLCSAYGKLQGFPNFIVIVDHDTFRSRSHFELPVAITTLLPTSKILLSNIHSVRLGNFQPLVSQNVTIDGCDRVSWDLCRLNQVHEPRLKKIKSLNIENPSPQLDTLAQIQLENSPSDSLMVSYSYLTEENTDGYVLKNKSISATSVLIMGFAQIEGLRLKTKKLNLSPYDAPIDSRSTIMDIDAPNLLEFGIRTHHGSEPIVERLNMPNLERLFYDNISGGDREERAQAFLREMEFIKKINTDKLQVVSFRSRNSDLLFKNASGFTNLTEFEFVASQFHSEMTSKDYGEFPNLRRLDILLRLNEPKTVGRVPELKAPNLKFMYFQLHEGTVKDEELSRVLATYTKLDQLKLSFLSAGDFVNIPKTLFMLDFCAYDLILLMNDFKIFANPESNFPKLISLSLTGYHGSEETLFNFKAPVLQRLNVLASELGRLGELVRIGDFPRLITLTIAGIGNIITTVDKIQLEGLPSIEDIYFGVTTKKVEGGSMPHLKLLRLTIAEGCTVEEVVHFKEVHPKFIVRT